MTPGTTLFGEARGHFVVGATVGSGGGGEVFRVVGDDGVLVKIWHAAEVPAHTAFVLKTIKELTDDLPYIAHIVEAVRTRAGGEIIGLIVERIDGVALTEKKFRSVGRRAKAARKIARTFGELLTRGAHVSDGNGGNVIVAHWTGNPYLIDIDSLAFGVVVWPDGKKAARHPQKITQNWSPPEFWNKGPIEHTPHTSAFVLARLVYQCVCDAHPGQCADVDGKDIPLRPPYPRWFLECRWGRFATELPKGVVPVERGVPYADLPERLRMLFSHAFSQRCLADPALRVPVQEIAAVLEERVETLTQRDQRIRAVIMIVMFLWMLSVMLAFIAGAWIASAPAPQEKPPPTEQKK